MKILRMNLFDGEGKTKAFFDIETGDGVIIKGFKIVDGSNGLFASPPSEKGKDDKYYDQVILPKEMKKELNELALSKFDEMRNA